MTTAQRSQPSQPALPDPGEQVPTVSWPIVGIFTFALVLFGASTWAALTDTLPAIATIAASAAAIFVMFTVLHDASHYSISSHRWVNVVFGRVAMFFVSPLISFKSFAFIHIEHHRNTNDGANDPDHFVSAAPWWQLPVRFPAMDLPYIGLLVRNVRRRPRAEIAETVALMTLTVTLIVWAAFAGQLWTLAVVYLIPERVAMFVLAWWFDWLPHHDLEDTQRENRYRATRNRVGSEWILTPLLLSQNYHLVHHLHPSIPFYRYVAAWQRNEAAYLDRDPAMNTVFGQQLDATQYREWKRLNGKLAALLPVRAPRSSAAARHASTHPIPVKSVEPLTPGSVKVTFDVPDHLRDQFGFQAGQHLTVNHRIGGKEVRRNYSICTSATSGELAIGIRQVDGGVFSTFAVETLRAGDVLELMTPTGSFGAPLDPLARRDYIAVAAGSGITPILSILRTTIEIETESRFTLFYSNRTAESTMFAAELDGLEARYADRLHIFHIRSAEARHPESLRGRIDLARVQRLLGSDITSIDRWYLCGPGDLVTTLQRDLTSEGVPSERVHLELFRGTNRAAVHDFPESDVTITLSGSTHTVALAAGETVLESALKNNIEAPYACLGGACGTCKAKITTGAVTMEQNFALRAAELEAGFVLTCQSHPTTPTVAVDYDA